MEAEIAVWATGRTPDSILIIDCVSYCLNYCDRAHHLPEDLIFAQMIKQDREATTQVTENLEASHAFLTDLARKLERAANEDLRSAGRDRNSLKSLADEFITSYRSHTAMEEEKLFPLADRLLGADE